MKKLFFISFLLLLPVEETVAQDRRLDSLKSVLTLAKEDTVKMTLLLRISGASILNSADSAVIYAQKALALAEKLNDERRIAVAQNLLCGALTTKGNYPLALEYGFKARSGFEKLRDTLRMASPLLVICFRDKGDYSKALEYMYSRIKLIDEYYAKRNETNSTDAINFHARQLGAIGSIYERNNQLDSAIKYAEKAYLVHKNLSGLLYVLGSAYAKKGQYDKGMHFYKLGIPLAVKDNFQKDIIEIHNGIARIFKAKNRLDSAAFYCKNVLGNPYGKFFPAGLLAASTMLATIYESQNKTDSSFKYLKQTIALKDSLFNQGKTIAFQNLVFKEDQRQKDLKAAEVFYQNRLKIYGLIGGLAVLLLVALLLWRNNQHKQKAYSLLHSQKEEINLQRNKAEKALTELKSTQAQLVQKEKLASLGELTAGIAHEIQNPLNFVNNFSEVSEELVEELEEEQQKTKRDPELEADLLGDLKQNLQKINHHGKRASSIVKGMLEHSRTGTGERQLTDINQLADEYLRLSYHGLRAKDSQFNSDYELMADENSPKIEVVPQEIGRVLLNLINNAFYAVNERAKRGESNYQPKVTVSTKISPLLQGEGKGEVEIRVQDNGTGIPDAIKAKIFQPFFTTKPTGEGTGLGLSLAYDIVTKGHGGTMEVESVVGEGTTFIVKLPQ
jgi:two-component system NtrC family sensor kinase